MREILYCLFRRYDGIFFTSDISGGDKKADIASYIFRQFDPDIFDKDPIFSEKGRAKKFRRRCEEGHCCYGFLAENGRVASYIWVSFSADFPVCVPWLFNLKMIVQKNTAYAWDCRTAEEHRQRGLYKYGLLNVKCIYGEKGAKKAFIFCERDNKASIAGITSAGFESKFGFGVIKAGFVYRIKKSGNLPVFAVGNDTINVICA